MGSTELRRPLHATLEIGDSSHISEVVVSRPFQSDPAAKPSQLQLRSGDNVEVTYEVDGWGFGHHAGSGVEGWSRGAG